MDYDQTNFESVNVTSKKQYCLWVRYCNECFKFPNLATDKVDYTSVHPFARTNKETLVNYHFIIIRVLSFASEI